MVSPSTPRRSSNRTATQSTPSKGATIAAAAAVKNSTPASVKDRIRQWQEQGGGVTGPLSPPLDAVQNSPSWAKAAAMDVPETKGTPKPSVKKQSPQASPEKTPKRTTTRTYVDPNAKEWIRAKPRSTSTPRKRIVSDDNWTKRYGSPREAKSVPGTPQPGAAKRTPPRKISDRTERRARRREGTLRQSVDKEPIEKADDDSIRVAAATMTSRYEDIGYDDIVVELESSLPDSGRISPPVVFPKCSPGSKKRPSRKLRDSTSTPMDADDSRDRRKSSYAEALEAPADSIAGSSTKFGSFKSRAKQLFSKTDASPVPAPRVPTIEAWLDETSDPFVDNDEAPVDVPAPLKTRSRRRKVSEGTDVPDHIQEEPAHEDLTEFLRKRESDRRRRRRTRPSLDKENEEPITNITSNPEKLKQDHVGIGKDLNDEHVNAKEMSPSTLRRRGAARGARSKSRGRSANTAEKLQGTWSPQTASPVISPPAAENHSDPFTNHATGARLFQPRGERQLPNIPSEETIRDRLAPNPSDDMLARGTNELRRRLTTNDDLMSVLSMPRTGSRKIRSARSVRSRKHQPQKQNVDHILQELADDENRYMRELNTLVDGVIPVLLQCILSKSEMSTAGGLFGGITDSAAITKPVMDMGIALERLKSLHKRIPLRDTESLYSWAQGAHKVYQGYIGSWRMGFQDVIINLAPAHDEKDAESRSEGGMARDAEGDVIDSDGKKVDVAHLLKRPLVRLKHLSKTFEQLKEANSSPRAESIFHDYQDLVELARRRSNEERGRLEDEAAAGIDPTKARDTRSLAILSGVTIDKARTVKARDYFNLTLHHSSGQRIDCRVELVLRDDRSHPAQGGDLLLCEVDDTCRWLLFPPVMSHCLSARIGDVSGEVILMIRGTSSDGYEWHELLSLHNDDEPTCCEWVQMVGSDPMPPNLFRSQSFINRQKETSRGVNRGAAASESNRTPSPSEIDVPIGEPSVLSVDERHQTSPDRIWSDAHNSPTLLQDRGIKERSPSPKRSSLINRKPVPSSPRTPGTPQGKRHSLQPTPSSPSLNPSDRSKRHSLYGEPSSTRTAVFTEAYETNSSIDNETSPGPKSPGDQGLVSLVDDSRGEPALSRKEQRPGLHRAPSSTPSRELPTIPRVRGNGAALETSPQKDSVRDHWASIREAAAKSSEKISKLRKPFPGASPVVSNGGEVSHEQPPPPPAHRSPASSQIGFSSTPELRSKKSPRSERHRRRRSSSPLKHEYAPSTATSSSSDSEDDFSDSTSDTSDEDLEANDVAGPLPAFNSMKRKSMGVPSSRPTLASTSLAPSESASQAPFRRVPTQEHQKAAKTIAMVYYWAEKGSWNPIHPDECSIVLTPGLIQAFEMTAAHSGANGPDLSSATSSDISSSSGASANKPLIGLELTPLVPLRRGTALDISIRSPPVEGSRFKASNNIMLRSRNAEECDVLYAMINQARINNPTYIALQNARPSHQPPVTFNTGPTQGARHSQSSKRSSTWFFGGGGNESKPSYRASSAPGPSIAGGSENSVGTITSAIRRLSGSSMFNISRSAVLKKAGGPGTASLYSSSSGGTGGTGEGSGTSTPIPGIASASMGGINNLKIRLYIREDQSKWRDMGAARLTVLPALPTAGEAMSRDPSASGPGPVSSPPLPSSPPPPPQAPFSPMPMANRGPRLPSSTHSPHRIHGDGREKRILITSSKKAAQALTLLDVCLGESCFERVARTGIAVSVWEEHEEGIAKEGGVVGGKGKVFMVQCAGEAEAAWVFGIVGRSRY